MLGEQCSSAGTCPVSTALQAGSLPTGRQEGAQYEQNFLCSHSVRHWRAREALRQAQSREICRTAPTCLPRPNGVGGELHKNVSSAQKNPYLVKEHLNKRI